MEIPIRNDMTRDKGDMTMNIFAAIDLETTGLDPACTPKADVSSSVKAYYSNLIFAESLLY